jgi:hypothetical protein
MATAIRRHRLGDAYGPVSPHEVKLGYRFLIYMDADISHDLRYLADLLRAGWDRPARQSSTY